ncbi:MAG: hypothetical protein ACYDAZ_09175 [Thermoplasmataceae archaeon]
MTAETAVDILNSWEFEEPGFEPDAASITLSVRDRLVEAGLYHVWFSFSTGENLEVNVLLFEDGSVATKVDRWDSEGHVTHHWTPSAAGPVVKPRDFVPDLAVCLRESVAVMKQMVPSSVARVEIARAEALLGCLGTEERTPTAPRSSGSRVPRNTP